MHQVPTKGKPLERVYRGGDFSITCRAKEKSVSGEALGTISEARFAPGATQPGNLLRRVSPPRRRDDATLRRCNAATLQHKIETAWASSSRLGLHRVHKIDRVTAGGGVCSDERKLDRNKKNKQRERTPSSKRCLAPGARGGFSRPPQRSIARVSFFRNDLWF